MPTRMSQIDISLNSYTRRSMIIKRQHSGVWQGIHRVGTDQLIDVHRVGVGRIFS